MHVFITLVNEQLCWEEVNPHRHHFHDPPHAVCVGFLNGKSPPQRLTGVAKSYPWRTTLGGVEFPVDATRRGRLPWVVGWNIGRGEDYLWRGWRGEDCLPKQEICPIAKLGTAKIALGCWVRPLCEQHWRGLLVPDELPSRCLQHERGLVVQGVWCSVNDDNTLTETTLMGTPAKTLDHLNKVVVGFLHGGRLKGYVDDFSPLEGSFSLHPQEDPIHGKGIKVEMKDLKAVYFVWDFTGNPEYQDSPPAVVPKDGRTIEVTFTDGEKIVGRTEGHSSQRIGFFMYPADPKGNNIRIFVVTRNTRQIRLA
jgi:hypothetical protein